MADGLPANNRELIAQITTFVSAATPAPAEYGTDTAELGVLTTQKNALQTAENEKDAAKLAYDGKVTAAETARGNLEDLWRPVRRDAYAHADDQELRQAGLDPHKSPSKTDPQPPVELVVVVLDGGKTNRLAWGKGANGDGTQWVIEVLLGAATSWQQVDVWESRKYLHTGRTPGEKAVYRIRARRRGILSEPSNEAAVNAS